MIDGGIATMEASVNASSVTAPPATPGVTRATPPAGIAPAVPPVAPARPVRRPRNWSMIVRVGLVVGFVLFLVGYAMKVTYESVIRGGVVSAGDHFRVELKQMSNFEMDQVGGSVADVPERYRELDGKKVILEGEVAPAGFVSGDMVKQFSLCYSVAKCCFGGPPKVQHFVACRAADGKPLPNYEGAGMIRVYGTLSVKVVKNDAGKIDSVFQLAVNRIEPVS
jgi:hypothetical protein